MSTYDLLGKKNTQIVLLVMSMFVFSWLILGSSVAKIVVVKFCVHVVGWFFWSFQDLLVVSKWCHLGLLAVFQFSVDFLCLWEGCLVGSLSLFSWCSVADFRGVRFMSVSAKSSCPLL